MAGGSILGGVLGGKGAKKAANAQTDYLNKGLDLQKSMFDTVWNGEAPWRDVGGQAIQNGAAMLQPGYDYTASPSYRFQLQQGNDAIQNSAAAKGMLMSGGTLKDIARFTQGLASSDFNDSFNRQMALASGGQQAMQVGANAANQYSANGATTLGNIGNAKASGYAGVNQAVQGTLSNLFSIPGLIPGM